MARIIRTTTQTAKIKVPFHYICGNCGKRNDQVTEFAGSASETRTSSYQHASGTLGAEAQNNLTDSIRKTEEGLRAYERQLRAAREGENADLNAMRSAAASLMYSFPDAVCAYCGRKPNWRMSFTESKLPGGKKSRKGCLIPVAGLVLAIIFTGIATLINMKTEAGTLADIVGFTGYGILFAGVILYFIYKRRNPAQRQTRVELASALIDPDLLPKLDLEHIGSPIPVPHDDRLAVPAKITLVRDSAFYMNGVIGVFRLNETEIGELKNGETLSAATNRKHNVLYATAVNSLNSDLRNDLEPLVFAVEPGAQAEIHFKSGKFLPDACTGIRVIK